MREASQRCVNKTLLHLLSETISREIPGDLSWQLAPDPDDPDEQTLLFIYPTAFPEQLVYLRQVVKVELGARSDIEPTQEIVIHPYVTKAFPDQLPQEHFSVRAVSPERTFWEKAMLLQEETFRPPEKKRQARLARHYYDLYRLVEAGIGEKASGDLELFNRIAAHRRVYFPHAWVDYSSLCPGSLRLVPPDKQLSDWRSDYAAMKDEMFFGEPPVFEDMIKIVQEFQDSFNRKAKEMQGAT